jgi:FixJ family two-component response regulator
MSKRRNVVAVIEDNPGALRALKHVLSAYGYEPELYSSGKGFFDAAAASEASCLLIDVQLGDDNGIELAGRLAKAGFHFPIVFMTGRDDEAVERQAAEAGCVALLRKPIAAAVLIAVLIRAMA